MSDVAGLILASGMSRRFGDTNKPLAPIEGVPLVRRVTEAFASAGLHAVIIVVGHEAKAVRAALAGLPVEFVTNPDYDAGQSRALVRGVDALPPQARGALIGVGDQPYLSAAGLRLLVERFRTDGDKIIVPRYDGRRGNPVLFAARHFPELLRVRGDQGGRAVLAAHPGDVIWVDMADARPGLDIDTLEDYQSVLQGME